MTKTRRSVLAGVVAGSLASLGGCLDRLSGDSESTATVLDDDGDPVSLPVETATIFQSETCGCCVEYADILADRTDLSVEVAIVDDPAAVANDHGVPRDAQACHTVAVGDYVVEGHVPVVAIEYLFEQRPDATGIAVPGMPAGSPGMGGRRSEPLDVLLIRDGDTQPFVAVTT